MDLSIQGRIVPVCSIDSLLTKFGRPIPLGEIGCSQFCHANLLSEVHSRPISHKIGPRAGREMQFRSHFRGEIRTPISCYNVPPLTLTRGINHLHCSSTIPRLRLHFPKTPNPPTSAVMTHVRWFVEKVVGLGILYLSHAHKLFLRSHMRIPSRVRLGAWGVVIYRETAAPDSPECGR